jgi:hypothetical protein
MTDAAPASPDVTAAAATAKAALYLRVSTGRQAESDLSIPDQRRQITAYCVAKGWDVAAEFVEPGNTATDDRRPAFQAMIDAALVKPPSFSVILAGLKQSRNPISDSATGAINLVLLMRKQSRGTMPEKALVPAAMTLMLQALDFVDKAGIAKVGKDELVQATHIFTNHMFEAFGVTLPMLTHAANQVHAITQDPAKMELLNRRAGVVKDPRASVPTPMPAAKAAKGAPT